MSDVRIIKKYPNRRLYDTHISRYITLEEIRQLVVQDIKFRVEDKRSHQDITRSILLQVIAEQEEGGDPIFTNELLEFIIRYYGNPMQNSIGRYLELSARLFHEQQEHFTDQLKQMLGHQPMNTLRELADLADRQVPIWRSIRKEFLSNLQNKTLVKRRRQEEDKDPKS